MAVWPQPLQITSYVKLTFLNSTVWMVIYTQHIYIVCYISTFMLFVIYLEGSTHYYAIIAHVNLLFDCLL